ncbi:MAG TPA: glycosyltransferase family 2 protein [Chitinophagales bacterium]|nr:glycosyltransferase family 2 protein [Chitinophagales bacterium]
MSKKFLTISIPAYNDSKSLVKLVNESQEFCRHLGLDFEMLIINDGSQDDTLVVAHELARKYNNITVRHHEKNAGFGVTLKEAFTLPKSEWVLFLPGDNQFPVSNLEVFLKLKDNYDYILGYRKYRRDTAGRKIYSFIYNRLISLVTKIPVRDVNSIVFYRSKILDSVSLKSTSAFVHAEFFIKTVRQGFRVCETEVVHQEREFGLGAGGSLCVIAATIKELFLYIAGKI